MLDKSLWFKELNMGRDWRCSTCNKNKVVVVPDPSDAEHIVQKVSNKNGLVLAYVCAHCTNMHKDTWLGHPKRLQIDATGYIPTDNIEQIFINPSIVFGTIDGDVCVYRSGNMVANNGKRRSKEHRFVISTKPYQRRIKTFSGEIIAQHYRRECLAKCPVCSGEFMPNSDIDHRLRELGSDLRKPTKEEIIDSATPEFYPDSHDDIQAYLDQAETKLGESSRKKRKYAVKKELDSFFD